MRTLVGAAIVITFPFLIFAADYSGSAFIVRDPIISDGGSRSTSNNFELYSGFGQTAIGTSTSSSFEIRSGFLYYPAKSVVTAIPGNEQVGMHWSPTTGASIYDVGQAATSGGSYTFTTVGNVFTATRANLTNDTIYYFIVKGKDASGNTIATSSEVSAKPISSYYGVKTKEYDTTVASSTTFYNLNGTTAAISLPVNVLSSGEAVLTSFYSLLKDAAVADKPLPSDKVAAGTFYNISFSKKIDESSVSSFDKSVTVTFTYTDADISGIDESTLAPYRWNGSTWVAISGSSVDTAANTVTMSTASFSNFGLMGTAPVSSPAPASVPPTGGGLLSLGAAIGGEGSAALSTMVILKSRAYPNAQLNVFEDGSVIRAPAADNNDKKTTPPEKKEEIKEPPKWGTPAEEEQLFLFPDKDIPEELVPLVSRDPSVADNKYFVSFFAVDKDTGVSFYEVEERPKVISWFTSAFTKSWTRAESPHVLSMQWWPTTVVVRAHDQAGNFAESTAEKPIHPVLLLIFAGMLVVDVIIRRNRFYFKKVKSS